LPAEVHVFELEQPAASLSWKPCGDGCRELETPWAEVGETPIYVRLAAEVIDGEPWLAFKQRVPGELVVTWLGPVDGSAVAGFVHADQVTSPTTAGFIGIVQGMTKVFAVYAKSGTWILGLLPDGTTRCLARPHADSIMTGGTISKSRWAVTGDNGMRILSGPWPPEPDGSDLLQLPSPGEQHNLALWSDGFAWEAYLEPEVELWRWVPGGQPQRLLGGITDDACCAAGDKQWFVWLQGRGYHLEDSVAHWDSIDMMAAATSQSTLPLTGKVVRSFPGYSMLVGYATVNGGHWLTGGVDRETNEAVTFVVRISDGRLWRIPNRPGQRWDRMLYVTDEEVAIAEAHYGLPPGVRTIVRYELSSLGPGELPDGGM
jgi:hypothetical protein